MTVPRHTRMYVLLIAAVLAAAGAVWVAGSLQSRATQASYRESRAVDHMLEAMLDQETGLRGYALTADEKFLAPYTEGVVAYTQAQASARQTAKQDRTEALQYIDRLNHIAVAWQRLATAGVDHVRTHGAGMPRPSALRRKALMDRFRDVHAAFQHELDGLNGRDESQAVRLSVLIVLAVAALFGGAGYFLVARGARGERERLAADRRYLDTQGEFAETLQVTQNESEANELLKVHVERSIPGSDVVVLNRNNSANRLDAMTTMPPGSPMPELLGGAEPRSCLAIRLGRRQARGDERDPLLTCELCGKLPRASTCQPLLVGGEVIGSVLVEHEDQTNERDERRLVETVGQAAPVLANLRNLALAERRAATDALTGLPNKRAVQETLARMVAQAGRTHAPLAAILLDLDHFKRINDNFGHGKGDEVLAAAGDVLMSALRASDFAGRYGGEEFLVLLPATDPAGARYVAESLRTAIAGISVIGVSQPITASLGVAVLPADASDAEELVRAADRALYSAKGNGRNRVEATAGALESSAD